MNIFTECAEHQFVYKSSVNDKSIDIFSNGRAVDYDLVSLGYGRYSLIKDNRSFIIHLIKKDDFYHVHVMGGHFHVSVEDERTRKLKELVQGAQSGPSEQMIKAPIPGMVVKIHVKKGQAVEKNQPIVMLEAMKMENIIKAPCDCRVADVYVQENEAVQQNQQIMKLISNI